VLAVEKANEPPEADPLDASHLFFVELRIISKALREIGPEEVMDDDLPKIYAGRRPDHTNATEIARKPEGTRRD
jgi:hypothetical protein